VQVREEEEAPSSYATAAAQGLMCGLAGWLIAICILWVQLSVPPPSTFYTVTALPFSRTFTQAEFNGGTYGDAANEVWLKWTPSANEVLGGYTNAGGTFTPRTEVYEGAGMTLLRTMTSAISWWTQVASGTDYWIKITRQGTGASDFDWTAQLARATLNPTVPVGSLIINDDTTALGASLPATAWTPSGTLLGFLTQIPAGEIGDSLPSGAALIHDRFALHSANKLALFAAGLTYTTSVDSTMGTFPLVTNDGTKFWVLKRATNAIYSVTTAGVQTGPVATISGGDKTAMGVNAAGTIAYYADSSSAVAIKRWDLSLNSAMADLYVVPELNAGDVGYIAKTAINNNPGEILVLSDGSIVTWYRNTTAAPDKDVLLHISSAGVLINSYTYTTQQIHHIAYGTDSPAGIHIWFYRSAPGVADDTDGRVGHLVLSTGTLDVSFDTDLFSAGKNKNTGSATMFGPSASCTMVTVGYGSAINVVKSTVPDGSTEEFDFTAGGGLTPTTFALTDGETQSFTGLTAGSGYSVGEAAVTGWSTSFVVSNGSPPDNITVATGEVVTVTVTNTQEIPEVPDEGPCCATTGPGGAPTETGYNGTGTNGPKGTTPPTLTPRVIPPGGEAPSYQTCNSGGGTPATTANPSDATSLDSCKTPRVHIKWYLPDGSVRRYGKYAFTSTNGQAVSARVLRYGGVSQVLADRHGSFQAAQWTVTLADTDRAIRTILSTASTKYIDGREMEMWIEDASAGTQPFVLARGVVTDYKYRPDMTVDITVTDPLGYRYSSVSIDRPIPHRVWRKELFPGLPEEASGRPMAIIYGEESDDYTWSLIPERIPVGILPVVYLGPANTISAVGIPGGEWDAYGIAGHAISCVQSLFASNLLETPGPVRMSTSTYGSEFLLPGINVPKYYDITGSDGVTERVCLMFATGERSEQHIAGTVPITINLAGIEATGDGSGLTITETALQFQHFLSYWVVQNYLTGNWGAVPTFGDGTGKVRSSMFTLTNAVHAARLGTSQGYQGSMYIGDQKPAREWSKEWQTGGDMRLGVNHQGQLMVTTLDHTQSTSGLTTFTAQNHTIEQSFQIDPQISEIFNVYTHEYGVEPATGRNAGQAQTIRHPASITNHGERVAQATVNRATRQKPTADDVANRRLLQSYDAPTDVSFDLDLRGTALKLGQIIKVTHYQGVGPLGWTDRNLIVTGVTAYPDEDNFSTAIECEDWHDVLALGGSVLSIDTGTIDTYTIG
jgi:hypothetical protein